LPIAGMTSVRKAHWPYGLATSGKNMAAQTADPRWRCCCLRTANPTHGLGPRLIDAPPFDVKTRFLQNICVRYGGGGAHAALAASCRLGRRVLCRGGPKGQTVTRSRILQPHTGVIPAHGTIPTSPAPFVTFSGPNLTGGPGRRYDPVDALIRRWRGSRRQV